METICSRFKGKGFTKKGLSAIMKARQTTGLCALGLNIHLSEFSFIFHSCIHMIITLYSGNITSVLQLHVAFVVELLKRKRNAVFSEPVQEILVQQHNMENFNQPAQNILLLFSLLL